MASQRIDSHSFATAKAVGRILGGHSHVLASRCFRSPGVLLSGTNAPSRARIAANSNSLFANISFENTCRHGFVHATVGVIDLTGYPPTSQSQRATSQAVRCPVRA